MGLLCVWLNYFLLLGQLISSFEISFVKVCFQQLCLAGTNVPLRFYDPNILVGTLDPADSGGCYSKKVLRNLPFLLFAI